MKHLLFIFLISSSSLFAIDLKPEYAMSTQDFNASTIDKNIKNDFLIFRFKKNRHKKTFNSAYLINLFNEHNILLKDKTKGLVHVKQISNVDLEPVKSAIKKYYQEHYLSMQIDSVSIKSSSFIQDLNEEYKLIFKPKAYRYSSSSLQINMLKSKKRYFINYKINAKLKLFKARSNINRGKILTRIDVLYNSEDFTRLRGTPLKPSHKAQIRLRKRIQEGKIIYERDIELLPDVLKGKHVLARMIDGNVHLEFQATSLQDANIGDKIYIKKSNGKRLRVKVTGKNQVEIE